MSEQPDGSGESFRSDPVAGDLNSAIAQAVRDMAAAPTVDSTLDRAVELCMEALPSCDLAGVSVLDGHGVRTLAASNELLRRIDDLQFDLAQGPCYDALRNHEVVTSQDLATDERWPVWGRRMADEVGVRSSLSLRLFTNRDTLGALNLYARRATAFGSEDILEGQILAAHAAALVASSIKEDQLTTALEHRTVLGQATGILIERFGIDADAAFNVMRRISQTHNIKLYELAEDLVRTGHLVGTGPRVPEEEEPTAAG